jgi:lipopolysaccharide export system permease protein
MAMPAAVLFATVFSIVTFTRHSEITAAKASGVSFYRIIAPILLGAVIAAGLDLVVAEIVPITDARRSELLQESKVSSGTQRYNFVYAAEYGRVYKAQMLDATAGRMDKFQIERKGNGKDYPSVLISSQGATFKPKTKVWSVEGGAMHVIADTSPNFTISFASMTDRHLTEQPVDLMARPRSPQEMRFRELSRFISALERSGGDANLLRVERALKIAIPITCIVIALFGGTAYGIGVSLATTIIFLLMIQLTKAVGGKALINPDLAAWLPNAMFAVMGLVLLMRVRT